MLVGKRAVIAVHSPCFNRLTKNMNRFLLLPFSALVIGSIGIEAMRFVSQEQSEISRWWHIYPFGLVVLGWAVSSSREATTQFGSKLASILTVLLWLSAVTTPSMLYGFYNLGGEGAAPVSATPEESSIQPDANGD